MQFDLRMIFAAVSVVLAMQVCSSARLARAVALVAAPTAADAVIPAVHVVAPVVVGAAALA